jgi:hypothetical protein
LSGWLKRGLNRYEGLATIRKVLGVLKIVTFTSVLNRYEGLATVRKVLGVLKIVTFTSVVPYELDCQKFHKKYSQKG